MRRARATRLLLALAACLWAAAPAGAEAIEGPPGGFGLKDLGLRFVEADGTATEQAGGHPFELRTELSANYHLEPDLKEIGALVDGDLKDLKITAPPGIAANLTTIGQCSSLDFIAFNGPFCPPDSAVGYATVEYGSLGTVSEKPVYSLTPPPGVVMKLGFFVDVAPVTVEVSVNPNPPYNAVVNALNTPNLTQFFSGRVALWGVPAAAAHDAERGGALSDPERAFLTVPRACRGPLEATFAATSWQGESFAETIPFQDPLGFLECGRLAFSPEARLAPTTESAESPSGLDFELEVEDENLGDPAAIAASDIKSATLALPEGMTLNPSVAEGLAVCSPAQIAAESLSTPPGEGCPQASKVGTVQVETPLLGDQVLKGSLYVAEQHENPFGSLIALYMVIRDPEFGLLFKLAGRVGTDPRSGQIVTSFGEAGQELPQYPLSHVRIHLREGGRSPLISPPHCGTHTAEITFVPWADPARPLTRELDFEISSGPGGGPCPLAGPPPFEPGFSAGTLNNAAKAFSPFYARITRRDADQDLTRLSLRLPSGVLGTIAGLGRCPEAKIAAAPARSGREELAAPSCPPDSLIGRTSTGVGAGSQLSYVPGSLYLAGPYKGDPLSVVAIVPAVAGPFDVGNVLVRFALAFDPRTLEVEVDGAASDPIPHILEGIVLKVREVEAYADRPRFVFNPTGCLASEARATLFGSFADVFDPADDVGVQRSAPFRAADCARLGFRPRISFDLRGGTSRGAHPALRSTVATRPADANFKRAVVTLPRSAFLEQAHIRTICTRVQFAAGQGGGAACPPGSVYGHARAWTPLLDAPAEGPVYLRSSEHNLPDLVVALKGPPEAEVHAELVGRIDSHRGGIRATFAAIPDVPVSRFMLTMQGGAKGLIVNSRDLCGAPSAASVRLLGQNGRRHRFEAPFAAAGCG